MTEDAIVLTCLAVGAFTFVGIVVAAVVLLFK